MPGHLSARSEPGPALLRVVGSRGRNRAVTLCVVHRGVVDFCCCVGVARVSVRHQDGPGSGLRPAALTDQDIRPDRLEQLGLRLGPTEMVRGGETRPFTRADQLQHLGVPPRAGRAWVTPGSRFALRSQGEREWGRYQGGSGGF